MGAQPSTSHRSGSISRACSSHRTWPRAFQYRPVGEWGTSATARDSSDFDGETLLNRWFFFAPSYGPFMVTAATVPVQRDPLTLDVLLKTDEAIASAVLAGWWHPEGNRRVRHGPVWEPITLPMRVFFPAANQTVWWVCEGTQLP